MLPPHLLEEFEADVGGWDFLLERGLLQPFSVQILLYPVVDRQPEAAVLFFTLRTRSLQKRGARKDFKKTTGDRGPATTISDSPKEHLGRI